MWAAKTVRDFWIFGKVVCEEIWTATQWCSGNVRRDFLKGELRHAEQRPHAQLPRWRGERTGGAVGFHSVQLHREIRKVHSKGIYQCQPRTASKLEAAQSGELWTVSAIRVVGGLGTGEAGRSN